MKASVCVMGCFAMSETQISVQLEVSFSHNPEARVSLDAPVSYSASGTQINAAIRNRIIAAAPEFGAVGLAANDITIFGGVA